MKIQSDNLEKGFTKGKLFPAIILVIVFIIFISLFVLVAYKEKYKDINNLDKTLDENSAKCLELGCSENTIYVGSINSDKYYKCTCSYANRIYSKNIICFSSKLEAENKGYKYIDC